MRLEGRVAVVTGFGSGIGRSTAVGFAKEGAKVIGLSRSTDSGEETARLVREAGSDALFISTDIQKLEDVEAAMAQGIAAFGRLDIAVNSAGVRVNGAAADLPNRTGTPPWAQTSRGLSWSRGPPFLRCGGQAGASSSTFRRRRGSTAPRAGWPTARQRGLSTTSPRQQR